MFKKMFVVFVSFLCLQYCNLTAKQTKESPLSDPILIDIDGVSGLMDKKKIENTLWLIKEIKHVHSGHYRVNSNGEPDPSRGTVAKDLIFNGKIRTIKNLVELETQVTTFSADQKSAFNELFQTVKEYFDKVTKVLAPEAAGSHQFMHRLTEEFCRKHNRSDSLLLNWSKGDEVELYRKSVTSFKIFQIFSTDLMNFLADLIMSCPKAFNAYKKSVKGEPVLQEAAAAA